jgi:hypothetical protein
MRITSVVHGTVALGALSLTVAANAEAATSCGYPGPNEAIVYDQRAGNCDVLEIGSYPYSVVNALSVGNDNITYVWPGSNVKVTLYENDLPGTGPSDWVPVITWRSVVSDFDRKTSAIRVEARTGCADPGPNQCVVWQDFDYSGNCDVVDLGYPVTYAKILGLSVGNDAISAIKCGSSSEALLWEDDLESGSSLLGMRADEVSAFSTFNDKASSLVVRAVGCTVHGFCGDNGFCELPTGGCTATIGVCTKKPLGCSGVIAPSCGCDGRSYGSDCERQAVGMPEYDDGVCSSQTCPRTAPTAGTSCSPADSHCVYSVPNTDCTQRFTCVNGAWSSADPLCGFSLG